MKQGDEIKMIEINLDVFVCFFTSFNL